MKKGEKKVFHILKLSDTGFTDIVITVTVDNMITKFYQKVE